VVLSDLVMPRRGALELLAALRPKDARLAFVVMSGYLTMARAREVLLAGACDCLAKPCSTETLVRAMERAVMLRNTVLAGVVREQVEHLVELSVTADLANRAGILRQVDEAAQVAGFDPRRNRILLALDEAFVNAVQHGAQGDRSASIEVRASFSNHGGVVTVSDPGPGFDPLITGFGSDDPHSRSGLFLIKAASDDVHWLGRGNVCQMVFRQPGASGLHQPPSTRTSKRLKSV
jgi:anti-sigma regulatory factor (Ser/Thr protein kinase)